MSLADIYKRFLSEPSTDLLADHISLHYVPTTTTVQGAPEVVKQLTLRQLNRRQEKFLQAIEGPHGLALQIETTIEFVSGGGAYLPGLDDNFLTDREVTFPIIHMVQVDEKQRIRQIQLHWDQAALLKDLDVIGSRSKAWPIRTGKEQLTLMASNARSMATQRPMTAEAASSDAGKAPTADKSQATNGGQKVFRDPYSSLSLFNSLDPDPEADLQTPRRAIVPPRESAKPPPRNMNELFARDDDDEAPTTPSSAAKSQSFSGGPRTAEADPAASRIGGAARHYASSRLYGEDDDGASRPAAPDPNGAAYKAVSKKYEHFEFGDGDDESTPMGPPPPPAAPQHAKKVSRHQSQWDFEDFVTPQKPAVKVRSQDVRHFGWSDDEPGSSPVKGPRVAQPRRDAETHFEFRDDGTPKEKREPRYRKGTSQNEGMKLYENNLYDDREIEEDDDGGTLQSRSQLKAQPSSPQKTSSTSADHGPLSNITNTTNANANSNANRTTRHNKVFDSQFTLADDSPADTPPQPAASKERKADAAATDAAGATTTRAKTDPHRAANKMMTSSWDTYDESPESTPQRGARAPKTENVAGAGAGAGAGAVGAGLPKRPGANMQRHWGFGDESGDDEQEKKEWNGGGVRKSRPGMELSASAAGGGGGSGGGGKDGRDAAGGFWDF
ncbi:MAG: hypothetical protein M1826_002384 [Phylliscum demangeonii]|nr:MAG: hypothetical protein M1826_002384 [Phylliscum demangeonii]